MMFKRSIYALPAVLIPCVLQALLLLPEAKVRARDRQPLKGVEIFSGREAITKACTVHGIPWEGYDLETHGSSHNILTKEGQIELLSKIIRITSEGFVWVNLHNFEHI